MAVTVQSFLSRELTADNADGQIIEIAIQNTGAAAADDITGLLVTAYYNGTADYAISQTVDVAHGATVTIGLAIGATEVYAATNMHVGLGFPVV